MVYIYDFAILNYIIHDLFLFQKTTMKKMTLHNNNKNIKFDTYIHVPVDPVHLSSHTRIGP